MGSSLPLDIQKPSTWQGSVIEDNKNSLANSYYLDTILLLLQDWLLDDPGGLLGADNMLSYQLHYHWVAAAVHLGQEGKAGKVKNIS